ncbi:MAG: hypothetical protein J6T37_01490 [Bacteroidales bacterium]|nr:hypothetical protein [Bacteroidaceae bacterium]MBO5707676.1 hypothetical protein [Bacteroidaceae bacterium]MBO7528269.1 hypothetical protein [Bacteroidales bacterium]MBO7528530.1 hypothetical protein [Bacteroidales bacterium]
MANSVVKLSIDSHEFDANIKRAGEALNKFFDQAKKGDRTFEVIDDDAMEVVRAFGQMETKSKSASGQLAELTKGFTDLSLAYKRMTDEEKASPVGKEITNQLDILKGRIQDTKKDISDINGEINGGGGLTGALDQLAGKFGLNIQQLAGWGAAISAAKVALDVAKDAIFASESNVDEWGRTVEAAESVYNSFLQTLNNGDFSGFLSRIQDVITKARDAYDALDELQTRGGIVNSERLRLQARQTELKSIIRRQGADSDAGKAAQSELKQLEGQLTKAYKTEEKLNYNAFKQKVDEKLQEAGLNLNKKSYDFLMRSFSDDAVFETLKRNANGAKTPGQDTYKVDSSNPLNLKKIDPRNTEQKLLDLFTDEWRKEYKPLLDASFSARNSAASSLLGDARYLKSGTGGGTGGGGSTTTVAKELNPMQQAQKEISALTEEALTADEGRLEVIKKEIAALQEQVNVYKSIQDFVQGKEPNWNIQVGDRKAFEAEQKKIFEANGGTASRLESMQYSVMKEIKAEDTKVDTETLHTLLKDALQNNIDTTSLDLTSIAEQIGEGINVPDEKWQAILDKYNELKAAIGEEPIQIDFNTGKIAEDGKKADKTWQQAASAVQSVGSAFSQIEDPATKAMGTVMQAIASIALGFAQASAQAGSMGPWAWLAFLAAGAAATATTIATIHSLTGFAEGGIVQGNAYSGDNVGPVMLDAGELILNRSQQGTLAEALTSGNNQGGAVGGTPYVTGEKIVLGINNYGKKQGWGELVFSRR